MDTIFVSIASYMDQEVEHTINDLLKKSKQPQNIIIGVCIQDTIEELDRYKKLYSDNSNVRSIYINHIESKGCCWARSKIQSELFKNEKYYLQLDAHHRFVDGWDTICIEMLNNCVNMYSNDKIILSSYAVPCDLSTDVMKITHQNKPYKMKCEKFYNTKKVRYVPEVINTEIVNEPILSYTISAHLLFTFGTWVHDVPYDPNLYFDGEEDSLAIRSFTHGWDIYCPNKIICYHYYIRTGAKRHSDYDKEWYKLNDTSLCRFNKLINNEINDKYSLGLQKTMSDYIYASGIDYNNSTINNSHSVHKLNFSPLPLAKLRIIEKTDCDILLDYGDMYFCKKDNNWNEYRSDDTNHWCHFEEINETDNYFELFDSGRRVYLKLCKNLSEILVKTDQDYSVLFKSTISCIDKIETDSTVCIFNCISVNENNKLYCLKNKYNYICYDTDFDIEPTFESMSTLYDIMCFIGSNDILFSKQIKLENLKKQNIKCDPDIYLRYNNNDYIQNTHLVSQNKVSKASLFCKTNNFNIIKKINQQFK